MKEEDIDKRIERVVESVGSKKAAMRQWESERKSYEIRRAVAFKRWRNYGISAAASVVVICGVGLGIFLNRGGDNEYGVTSTAPVYRGGSCDIPEIQSMIDSDKYVEALQAIEASMADTVIDPSFTSDRQEYLRNVNNNRKYELTWLKVDILVKTEKQEEAITLLKEYVNVDGIHQEDAKHLLHNLAR